MAVKLFVNLPVRDLDRSKAFFTALGLDFFGATEDMASVVISEHTQVMLLQAETFAGYAYRPSADATEAILVLGLEDRDAVDALAAKAVAAGAEDLGTRDADGIYQRGFADLDGHQWAALTIGTGD